MNGSAQAKAGEIEDGRPPLPPSVKVTMNGGGEKLAMNGRLRPGEPHYGTMVSYLQEEALEVDLSVHGSETSLNSSRAGSRASTPMPDSSAPLLAPTVKAKRRKFFASWFTPSFVVIALVVLNGDMARGALFPTLWPLVYSLGGDRIVQGYVVSAFSFGRLISSPYMGHLSELYGYRRVLAGCCTMLLVGTLLYASATTIGHVLASQIIMGLGSGTLGVTRAYVAEQTTRKKRTILLAYLTAVQYAGFTVTPLIGGVLSNIFRNIGTVTIIGPLRADKYTSPALFMSIMSSLSVVLLLTVFQDSVKLHESSTTKKMKKERSAIAAAQAADGGTLESGVASSSSASSAPAERSCWDWSRQDLVILGGILLNVATKGSIAIYETLGIVFARSHFGISAPEAGFTFAFFGCLGVIALIYMKRLVSIWNDVELILGGMALMTVCNLVLLGPSHFSLSRFYVAIFLMYAIGYPVGHTAVIGMFSKVLGKGPQGYLMGWFGSAGSLARVIFPILGGHVAEELGYNWLFAGDAVLLVVSIAVLLVNRQEVLMLSEGDQ